MYSAGVTQPRIRLCPSAAYLIGCSLRYCVRFFGYGYRLLSDTRILIYSHSADNGYKAPTDEYYGMRTCIEPSSTTSANTAKRSQQVTLQRTRNKKTVTNQEEDDNSEGSEAEHTSDEEAEAEATPPTSTINLKNIDQAKKETVVIFCIPQQKPTIPDNLNSGVVLLKIYQGTFWKPNYVLSLTFHVTARLKIIGSTEHQFALEDAMTEIPIHVAMDNKVYETYIHRRKVCLIGNRTHFNVSFTGNASVSYRVAPSA